MKINDFDRVLDRIRTAEDWRKSNYEDSWKNSLRLHLSRLKNTREGMSNLFVPYTFMIDEVVRSRLAESLFNTRPYVATLPRGMGDDEKAKRVQTLLDWQLSERMQIEKLFKDEILAILVQMGTAVTYTGWQIKTREIKTTVEEEAPIIDESGIPMVDDYGVPQTRNKRSTVKVKTVTYDDPVCQSIDLFDFFTDPQSTSIEDARFCGHKEYRTKAQLKELEETAGYEIDWEDLKPVSGFESGRQTRLQENFRSSEGFSDFDDNGLYLVHHYWEDNRHVVIINMMVPAIDEENPFWHGMKPYDKCVYTPLANSFYGIGIPESVAGLQDELNTIRNQRIDYNSMALRRMWKLRKGCGLTAKDLVWRQNGILQIENMDDVQEINISPLHASAFSNEEIIKADMRDTTGCHDIIMGISQSDETATTTMTKDNNASIRFKDVVKEVASSLLVPIAQKCMALNQQFMSEGKAVRILEEGAQEIFEVSPFDLDGQYDMIYVGGSVDPMSNKKERRDNIIQAYNMAMNDPAYQADQNARLELFYRVLDELGIEDLQLIKPKGGEMIGSTQGIPELQGV